MNPSLQWGGGAVEGRKAIRRSPCGRRPRSRSERQPTSKSDDTANLPTTDDGIHPAGRIPAEPASAAEWKLIDKVRIDEMPDVEVGIPATYAEVASVTGQAAEHRVDDARLIINRVGQGVVEVELQTPREALPQAEQHAIIAG